MKPPEPFTWFIDRSLGRKIAVDLRAAGFRVEEHSDHFVHDAPDADWLAEVGRRGWIVLTKDKGDLKSNQMTQAFIAARERMEKALRRFEAPMTASVTTTGHVRVLMTAGQLIEPREIK